MVILHLDFRRDKSPVIKILGVHDYYGHRAGKISVLARRAVGRGSRPQLTYAVGDADYIIRSV